MLVQKIFIAPNFSPLVLDTGTKPGAHTLPKPLYMYQEQTKNNHCHIFVWPRTKTGHPLKRQHPHECPIFTCLSVCILLQSSLQLRIAWGADGLMGVSVTPNTHPVQYVMERDDWKRMQTDRHGEMGHSWGGVIVFWVNLSWCFLKLCTGPHARGLIVCNPCGGQFADFRPARPKI